MSDKPEEWLRGLTKIERMHVLSALDALTEPLTPRYIETELAGVMPRTDRRKLINALKKQRVTLVALKKPK